MPQRVAILVDGDNVSSNFAPQIADIGRQHGRVDIHRVYGNKNSLSNWATIEEGEFVYAGCGKNAADILLVIDAMEHVLTQAIDVVVIGSSDGDFVHLVRRLRRSGIYVVGCGVEGKAPRFQTACTEFHPLAEESPTTGPVPLRPAASDLDRKIMEVIQRYGKNGSGMRICDLNPRMRKDQNFQISQHPQKTWRAYLSWRPELYDLDPKGANAHVRLKHEGAKAT